MPIHLGDRTLDDAEPERATRRIRLAIVRRERPSGLRRPRSVGFEEPRPRLLVEPRALVLDHDAHPGRRLALDAIDEEPHPAAAPPRRRHRLERVRDEMRQRLPEEVGVAEHLSDLGVDRDLDLDRRGRGPAEVDRDLVRDLGDGDEFEQPVAPFGDGEHLLDELGRARRREMHVAEHLARTLVERGAAREHLAVEDDRPEQVVEVAGDSRGEAADRLHALALRERGGHALALDRGREGLGERAQRGALGAVGRAGGARLRFEEERAPEESVGDDGLEDRGREAFVELDLDALAALEPRAPRVVERRHLRAMEPRKPEDRLPHALDAARESRRIVAPRELDEGERAGADLRSDDREGRMRHIEPAPRAEDPLERARLGVEQFTAPLVPPLGDEAAVGEPREVAEEPEHLPVPRVEAVVARTREPERADDAPVGVDGQVEARSDRVAVARRAARGAVGVVARVRDIDGDAGPEHAARVALHRGRLGGGAFGFGQSVRVDEPQAAVVRIDEVDPRILDREQFVRHARDGAAEVGDRAHRREGARDAAVDLVPEEEPAREFRELVAGNPRLERLGEGDGRMADRLELVVGEGGTMAGEPDEPVHAEGEVDDAAVARRGVEGRRRGRVDEVFLEPRGELAVVLGVERGADERDPLEFALGGTAGAPDPDLAGLRARVGGEELRRALEERGKRRFARRGVGDESLEGGEGHRDGGGGGSAGSETAGGWSIGRGTAKVPPIGVGLGRLDFRRFPRHPRRMLRTNPASDRSARLARVAGVILLASGLALAIATAASSAPLSARSVAPAASTGAPAQDEPDTPVAPLDKTPAVKDRILVFSKTAGFRHDSIPTGVAAIREILAPRYEVDATEDSAVFTDDSLKRYRAVVFLSTTGDILDDAQQEAFERFIRAGGGYAGVHAAADTEYSWPWYGQLVGAYFKTHPPTQESTVLVEDRTHRSTRMLPAEWRRTDEWYVYQTNPRGKVRVLAALDDDTVEGADMGGDHPIAWYHEFEGGRAWYTGGGHTKESFAEPLFRKHLEGGILWAAGAAEEPAPTTPVKGVRPVEAPKGAATTG